MGEARGYFGVAVYHAKKPTNFGSLFRTANILGADFLGYIGPRYRLQSSDTMRTPRHVPLFEYGSFDDFYLHLPHDCRLVGVELTDGAQPLERFMHPERAVYLLGAEDYGLPPKVIERCHSVVKLRGRHSMNVSVAGSIVLYHRVTQGGAP
jgi:tRNA (guanosine-2'-O-)-methyltransferase